MRIIAGKYKNRVIPTVKDSDYRPSTAKFREAVFNILFSGEFMKSKPVEGAEVLDLFAGSGSLSFEALSRGATNATLVDINAQHLKMAENFARALGESDNITTHVADATNVRLPQSRFSLVFIDPPYKTQYLKRALDNLATSGCLRKQAIIVVEMSKYDDFEKSQHFVTVKEKLYGNNRLIVLCYE